VLAKHSKSFSLIDCISVAWIACSGTLPGDWQRSELTEITAKVVISEAFVEGKLEALFRRDSLVLRERSTSKPVVG